MARRDFGHIDKLPSGRFRVRYRYEGARYTAPHTFATRAEASTWLAGKETELERGGFVDPTAGKVTLADLLQELAEPPH